VLDIVAGGDLMDDHPGFFNFLFLFGAVVLIVGVGVFAKLFMNSIVGSTNPSSSSSIAIQHPSLSYKCPNCGTKYSYAAPCCGNGMFCYWAEEEK